MALDLQERFDLTAEHESAPSSSPRRSPSHMAAPLDLSFKNYLAPNDILEDINDHKQSNLLRSSDTGRFSCSAIRLNNNAMNQLDGFPDVMREVMNDVDDLAWLDLSFNDLDHVNEELLQFKNLKVLHLHGNCINKLEELNKLASFEHLRSLTIHGNPIENIKDYRSFVLSSLPRLKSLDFSAVTKQDRTKAQVLSSMKPKKQQRRTFGKK